LYHPPSDELDSLSIFLDGMIPVLFDVMRRSEDPSKLTDIFEDGSAVSGFSLIVKVGAYIMLF
jgi:hypothetical protein